MVLVLEKQWNGFLNMSNKAKCCQRSTQFRWYMNYDTGVLMSRFQRCTCMAVVVCTYLTHCRICCPAEEAAATQRLTHVECGNNGVQYFSTYFTIFTSSSFFTFSTPAHQSLYLCWVPLRPSPVKRHVVF